MIQEGSREVILRTLASDSKALANHTGMDSQRKTVRLSGYAQPQASNEQSAPTEPAKKSRRPLLLALVAVIALSAVGFAGYLLYSNLKTGGQTVETL